jgi:hypothetical protein
MRGRRILAAIFWSSVALAAEPAIDFGGYYKVRFGMPISAVAQLLRETPKRTDDPGSDSCYYVTFRAYPGTQFMVENHRVAVVDPPEHASNVLGLKVGMSVAEVRALFNGKTLTLSGDEDRGQYFGFKSPDGKSEIRAEVTNGLVTYVRAGLFPAVDYVEGCL